MNYREGEGRPTSSCAASIICVYVCMYPRWYLGRRCGIMNYYTAHGSKPPWFPSRQRLYLRRLGSIRWHPAGWYLPRVGFLSPFVFGCCDYLKSTWFLLICATYIKFEKSMSNFCHIVSSKVTSKKFHTVKQIRNIKIINSFKSFGSFTYVCEKARHWNKL